jgi:hypothetical protein
MKEFKRNIIKNLYHTNFNIRNKENCLMTKHFEEEGFGPIGIIKNCMTKRCDSFGGTCNPKRYFVMKKDKKFV